MQYLKRSVRKRQAEWGLQGLAERGAWEAEGHGGSAWANKKKEMVSIVIARYIPKPEKLILTCSQERRTSISTWARGYLAVHSGFLIPSNTQYKYLKEFLTVKSELKLVHSSN